ncbi:Lrp/AsnC family transcriptional regulator [Sandarakinorhabdus oryzae]|uniref:Lrp/AsnC family transcriptional regulator n=1 Tax=Sandarakinorhabdus oryzae TaxID=2675220 RepID=UPI0018CC0ACE|nr:Lrp/AsnC family transcriptional regulator [Sandarakinorhabdus oryzae]
MDELDRSLLAQLQQDGLATADQLAELVPLSPSAIARRLRRLRGDGTIAATRAILSERLLGQRLRALVTVQLHDHAPAAGLAALRATLLALPEVQLCLEISGPSDLVLLVSVADMPAFNEFADAHLAGNPVVRRYETAFVKKALKFSTAVPLAD